LLAGADGKMEKPTFCEFCRLRAPVRQHVTVPGVQQGRPVRFGHFVCLRCADAYHRRHPCANAPA
jgi:hypothetical protein